MRLRLDRLFENPGMTQAIDETFTPDWSDLAPFSLVKPVSLVGRVVNRAGVVTADVTLSSEMTAPCDRCLETVSIPVSLQIETILVRDLSSEEDEERLMVLPDACLDTEALARDELILWLPTRILCHEDCHGLCPHCGVNRNQAACDCFEDEEASF